MSRLDELMPKWDARERVRGRLRGARCVRPPWSPRGRIGRFAAAGPGWLAAAERALR